MFTGVLIIRVERLSLNFKIPDAPASICFSVTHIAYQALVRSHSIARYSSTEHQLTNIMKEQLPLLPIHTTKTLSKIHFSIITQNQSIITRVDSHLRMLHHLLSHPQRLFPITHNFQTLYFLHTKYFSKPIFWQINLYNLLFYLNFFK